MRFFQKIFLGKEREKGMSLKRIALLTALSSVLCIAADTNMTEQAKVWNDKLTEVIDLRKKALQDYNECLDRAGENNITAQEICKETLKMQGEELDDMRDGTAAYAKQPVEKNIKPYVPTKEEQEKDKKLSECFDKTDGSPECYHKFEDLNSSAYKEFVDQVPAVKK